MLKKVMVAGLSGAVAMVLFQFLANGIFGFNSRLNMKKLDAERDVYAVLKKEVVKPGHYHINPALTAEGVFPPGEPVFEVVYSGFTHGAAGSSMLGGLAVMLLACLSAAGMLSMASRRVLASLPRKLLFFVLIGVLFGLLTGVQSNYPPGDAILKTVYEIALWTVTGLAVSWQLRPGPDEA